ncbi:MAG: STAS domain-containing protein [Methylophaga sp.]|nr:STAS domain-containing protein [Methylophaga sp.]
MAKAKIIECGDTLGISGVGDLHTQILMELSEGHEIQFDVSQIERIDAAALQMIYAYSKEQTLEWNEPSEAFIRSAKLLGLAGLMNLEGDSVELTH